MRVLFLVRRLPFPPWRGDQVRGYHQIKHLAGDHEITVCLVGAEPERSHVEAVGALGARVETIPISAAGTLASMAKAPIDRRPVQALPATGRRTRRRVAELSQGVDLVHAQTLRTAPLLTDGGPPAVLDMIDAMSVNLLRRARHDRGVRGLAARIEARRVVAYERSLAAAGATIVAVTATDAAAIGSAAVVPNGVDLDRFSYRADGHDPSLVVFGGNLGYFPNVDAARIAARDVLPLLRASRPGTTLVLAGARPSRAVRRLASAPDVRVVSEPPDLGAVVARAGAALIPMRAGTGMQNKVLEAMAVGTPVVTTPMAAEAVGAVPGEHLLVGSNPRELADATIGLLEDRATARAMAERARRFVEEGFTWAESARRLAAVWERAAGR